VLTLHQLALFLPAMFIVMATPGPDMLLVISRGISQGPRAAMASTAGTCAGIMVHTVLVALGLSALLQASPLAFTTLKIAGGAYLLYLGWQALRHQALINFAPVAAMPLKRVFAVATLTNVLNPKVAIFMLAFVPQFVRVPQFVHAERSEVALQILSLGSVFAGIQIVAYAFIGLFAAQLKAWLMQHPRVVTGMNWGTGAVMIMAGLAALFARAKV
jgi:threonine/homoserine/homoserine lactone efflux protein